MALLERVGTLLRANINDLIDKAEDPEKIAKQLVLDMENQLLQVKTQVAIAIADQHLLQKKKKEHEDAVVEWHRKAEVAVGKERDDLARAALERSLGHQRLAEGFAQQLDDQAGETETLRGAFARLQQKLTETRSATEMLIAQHRRTRAIGKANSASGAARSSNALHRLKTSVEISEASNSASRTLLEGQSLEEHFAGLEREDHVERLLLDLKSRQARLG